MFELTNNELTMSSREIAELTGKRHDNVLVDIRKMLSEIGSPEKTGQYKDSTGRALPMILLNREEVDCLITGYSAKLRMTVIKRWRELENHTKSLALPNFNNPVEAARAWADQFEEKQIAYQKLEEAQPKIEFVDKYVDSTDLKGFRQVCKILKANESKFREFLLEEKIMYRLNGSLVAYQNHVDANRFDHKTGVAGNGHAFTRALFTAKGVEWVAGQWAKFNLRNAA